MRRPLVGILALAVLASACAIPTESPNWQTTWNLPVPDSTGMPIPVDSFLPKGVTVIAVVAPAQPTAFNVKVSATPAINRTLGTQCPACPNATAPKPAFTAPAASSTISLTAGTNLTSGTLAAGSQIAVALTNGFTFDPIRPPGGAPGTVTLTVNNGATQLGTVTLAGGTSAIPAGQTTNVIVPLAGTIATSSSITVTMTMDSPAGSAANPVAMSSGQTFTAAATPTINISSATVTIPSQTIAAPPTALDLSGIDSTIVDRIPDSTTTQGVMFLTVTNPYTVGAALSLKFTGNKKQCFASGCVTAAITPVTKAVALPAGTATPAAVTIAVPFTGVELRSILGSTLQATFTGTTTAGSTAVTPASKITTSSRLQLTIDYRSQK